MKIKEMMPSRKKIISLILTIFTLIIVTITLRNVFTEKDAEMNTRLKNKPVIVITGSMVPAMEINSISLMQDINIKDVKENDIIMFKEPENDMNITHRVIEIINYTGGQVELVTKGDANKYQDNNVVTEDILVGKIVKTYNWVAPIISKLMLGPGEINTKTMLQVMISLSAIVMIIGILGYNIIMITYTIVISKKEKGKLSNSIDNYTKSVEDNKKNIERIKEMTGGNEIKHKIARGRMIREIKEFENSTKAFNSALKLAEYIYGKEEGEEGEED